MRPRLIRWFVLAALAFPLFAARDLAPRAVAPTAYAAYAGDVAYTDDRYLAVWKEQMGTIGDVIRGFVLDGTGRRISEVSFPIVSTRGFISALDLVAVDGSFVLFTSEFEGAVSMTTVDRDGSVISRGPIDVPASSSMAVAWNGSRFLLATGSSAAFLDRNGTVIASIALTGAMRVAPRGDGFLAITQVNGILSAVLIDATGEATTTPLDETTGTGRLRPHPYSPVVTTLTDGRMIILWAFGTEQFSVGNEFRSAIVGAYGVVSAKRVALTPPADGVPYALHLVPHHDTAMLVFRSGAGLSTVVISAGGEAVAAPRPTVPAAGSFAAADNGSSAVAIALLPTPYFMSRPHAFPIDRSGNFQAPELLALMFARQTQPAIAWGVDRLLASWTDVEGDAAYVRSTAVTADGVPSGRQTVAIGFLAAQDLAWNGSHHLVVHYDNGRLRATRVDGEGRPSGDSVVLAEVIDSLDWSRVRPVAVVWAQTHWMVMWSQGCVARLSIVPASGDALPARELPLPAGASALALAFDGEHALLVAGDSRHDSSGFIRETTTAILLSPHGGILGSPLDMRVGGRAGRAAIATSGDEFVVVAQSTATVVRKNATFLSLGEVRALRGDGDITWDGRAYVTAHRRVAWHWTLEIQRFDRALNPIGEPRFVPTLPSDVFDWPSVAARAPHAALVAIQEGDGNGTRAVVYREDEFGPLPPLPPAPVQVKVSKPGDGFLEIRWEAPSHSSIDAYVVELVMPDGSLFSQHAVSPETRSFKTYVPTPPGPATIRVRASNANGLSELPIRRRAVGRSSR